METQFKIYEHLNANEGLNRTMQYGNLCSSSLKYTQTQFKSYYVVWKQECLKPLIYPQLQFKSYYVVWKLEFYPIFPYERSTCLNRTMQYGNYATFDRTTFRASSFKSYYVVWKLAWLGKHTVRKQCLNRTMQYGNKFMHCSKI